MPKKKKQVKNVMVKPITNHNKIQIDIMKDLDNETKIDPSKVFEGFKKPKVNTTKPKPKPTTKKKTTKSKY